MRRAAGLRSALDADFVRAVERGGDAIEGRKARLRCRRREELAPFAHLGREEGFEDGACLGAAGGHYQAAMNDLDPALPRDFEPDVTRAPGALPAVAALLAGHRDETEIADRGAVRLGVAIDDEILLPRRAAASACARPQFPPRRLRDRSAPDAFRLRRRFESRTDGGLR